MNRTETITPEKLEENIFDLIGKRWFLVSAVKSDGSANMMTASWGGAGVLWGKNVCFVFVRPTRYTYEFTEESRDVTLSFFEEKYRGALRLCGTKSGRDINKLAESGLKMSVNDGFAVYDEADITIRGRKLYFSDISPDGFVDKSLLSNYDNDFHRVYVYEILSIERKKK